MTTEDVIVIVDDVDDATEFVDLLADNDYEISTTYPFIIRRKDNGFIPKDLLNTAGYVQVKLNRKMYLKHRLVAQQFIENDDPVNKTFIDHITMIELTITLRIFVGVQVQRINSTSQAIRVSYMSSSMTYQQMQ